MTADLPELDILALHELVLGARQTLNDRIWGYLIGGAETETTTRRNRLGLDSLAFRPRVLKDVSQVSCAGRFLDRDIRLPVFVAPVAALEHMHAEGASAMAQGAMAAGLPMCLSSVAQPDLETVARAAPQALRVYQPYVRGDDGWMDAQVARAVAHGYSALCITADTAVYSRRERDIAKRYIKPWRERATGLDHQAAFSWRQVERLKQRHRLPIIVKGIATAEDAELACAHGVDVVYVSNHGGRQLDHGRATIDLLPEVVQALRGRLPVWVDGGFCRGSDIAKALALGASAVGLGRLACWALAAAGPQGLVRMADLIEDELRICLALLGLREISELSPASLHPAAPVFQPHVLSAFPMLAPWPDDAWPGGAASAGQPR